MNFIKKQIENPKLTIFFSLILTLILGFIAFTFEEGSIGFKIFWNLYLFFDFFFLFVLGYGIYRWVKGKNNLKTNNTDHTEKKNLRGGIAWIWIFYILTFTAQTVTEAPENQEFRHITFVIFLSSLLLSLTIYKKLGIKIKNQFLRGLLAVFLPIIVISLISVIGVILGGTITGISYK